MMWYILGCGGCRMIVNGGSILWTNVFVRALTCLGKIHLFVRFRSQWLLCSRGYCALHAKPIRATLGGVALMAYHDSEDLLRDVAGSQRRLVGGVPVVGAFVNT